VHQNLRSLYQNAQLDIRNGAAIRNPAKSHHRLRTDAKKRQQVAAGGSGFAEEERPSVGN
jgi:hypothetical protein